MSVTMVPVDGLLFLQVFGLNLLTRMEDMEYRFAIRDINDGAIHRSRYSCLDDAMSAAEELAYELEMELDEFEVVELKLTRRG